MIVPSLIRWIERLARDRNWSDEQLAQELDLTPESWAHVRAGRDAVSLALLLRLGEVFGSTPATQRALAEYLLLDGRNQHPRSPRRRRGAARDRDTLPDAVRWRLRRWMARQTIETDTPQRGLYLESVDPPLLTAATRMLTAEAAAVHLDLAIVRPNERLTTSHAAALLARSVLIIERVDHASDTVKALLDQRSNALAPFIVTSAVPRSGYDDPHLVRLFRTWTHLVRIPARGPRGSRSNSHTHARHI